MTTLDDHLAAGTPSAALDDIVEGSSSASSRADDDAVLDAGGPRLRAAGPSAATFRDFYAFEGHVRTMWERRGGEIPRGVVPPADLLLLEHLRAPRSGRARLGAAGHHSSSTSSSRSVRWSTRRPWTSRRGGRRRRSAATAILNDWSARDLQRDETDGPPRAGQGQGLRHTIGPWLVTPGRAGRRAGAGRHRTGPGDDGRGDRRGRTAPTRISRGSWADRPLQLRRDAGQGLGRRPAAPRRPHRSAARSARAASSRSGTPRSVATWSRATR